jgi:Periplasmic pectate lyase
MRVTTMRAALTMGLMMYLAAGAPAEAPDHLTTVRAYADALLEHGRDTYGEVHSPLFAVTLDRGTLNLLEGEAMEGVAAMPRESWGIRSHDRMLTGANPMQDQNLYQVLYALTAMTGEKRYAQAADDALKFFFEHCQSPQTSLMAWGEHIGWDLLKETRKQEQAGNTHEFYRPWVLWGRCFDLAQEPSAAFARGVWDHQIGDHETGNFSRHAQYDAHGPGTNSEYPRHGGFYIATWAHAYGETKDPVFVKAIETVLSYFDGRRSPISGAIPAESAERSKGKMIWPPSNLSLAVDLFDGAQYMPEDTAARMRESAAKIDDVFLRLGHDLGADGKGFVKTAHTDTLGAGDVRGQSRLSYTRPWATGYGEQTDAQMACLCRLRYGQVERDGYRDLILATAARYLASEPDIAFPVYPGALGDAIFLMLDAHELTGEATYLDRARHFADRAIAMFLDDSSPLPKASTKADHYEAITRADTLMMSLLRLWAVEHKPDLAARLIYNDR